jgi:histidinol phosphatase-like enzyme (inositol monophosphatase family)
MTLADVELSTLEAFALELANAAGEVILPLFRPDPGVGNGLEDKGPAKTGEFDPVTLADKGAEAAIRRLIAERYPDHGVIGEEYGENRPDAEFVWVLDPIDGTRAFIAGLPLWTTLIGLRHQGRPVVGAIGQSYIGEVFLGSRRGASLVRGSEIYPLRVRACASLGQALIATTDQNIFKGEDAERWAAVRATARVARFGCDAYAYAMVAMGAMDAVVETGLKAWDIEAAIPIIEGAGGFISHWNGDEIGPHGGNMLIAGDERVRDELIALLA